MAQVKKELSIRSGRFKSDDALVDPGNSIDNSFPIIRGRHGAIYRIFNSGERAFTVYGNGETDVEEAGSVDIVVASTEVKIGADTTGRIEGIYDLITVDAGTRSGRFNIDQNTDTARTIIDLRPGGGGNKPEAYYRVYNSGDSTFQIQVGTAAAVSVHKQNSYDFEIPTTGGQRQVTVVAAANTPYEGIYEYLGSAS